MKTPRESFNEIGKIYFFTATIHQWKWLLGEDTNKKLIVDYLKELSRKELIKVYAFVLMPNHVHIIWQQLNKNGKETSQGSFLKYTAHEFLKNLKCSGYSKEYEVNAGNKKHEIWQRDSLSVEIYSREVAKQKLEYIHFNPVSGKWKLAKNDLNYYYSSAKFYETGVDDFGFLHDLYVEFDGE
jgi:REP element-mobilizing transposase RayT